LPEIRFLPLKRRRTWRLRVRHYSVGYDTQGRFRNVIPIQVITLCWPELPGCSSASEAVAEATANVREAIELYLMSGDIDLLEDAKFLDVR
jgi:hypothetical protein